MTVYNTSSDAANTAVRAFLTKIGEDHLTHSFNTASGKGKADWQRIKELVFNSECAYCGAKDKKLTIEHLVMFNRVECGLHHPGNIVPCCTECNKRTKVDGIYIGWKDHLSTICKNKKDYSFRKKRIEKHMRDEGLPELSDDKINKLRVIADRLYNSIRSEIDKSLVLYKKN